MVLLPQTYLNSVIAIGLAGDISDSDRWIETGFLVGRPFEKGGVMAQHDFLVTNKHVLKGLKSFVIGFNPKAGSEGSKLICYRSQLVRNRKRVWTGHPHKNIDIAVVGINARALIDDERIVEPFDLRELMSITEMKKRGVSEGDFIYILGYPMAAELIDQDWHDPIVRSGTIARIRDMLDGRRSEFLLDTFGFPGNSGGPVILKPEHTAIAGTEPIDFACVIGIVSHHLSHYKTEQHSGLTKAVPAEYILDTIEAHVKRTRLGPNSSLYLDLD